MAAGFDKIKIDRARWHVFLCAGPDCCSSKEGDAAWDALKHAVKATGVPTLRTKSGCLRVCAGGPWLVVYPDGTWYGQVTPERCERILREHLGEGRPVTEWIAKEHPLPGGR